MGWFYYRYYYKIQPSMTPQIFSGTLLSLTLYTYFTMSINVCVYASLNISIILSYITNHLSDSLSYLCIYHLSLHILYIFHLSIYYLSIIHHMSITPLYILSIICLLSSIYLPTYPVSIYLSIHLSVFYYR